MNIYITDEVYFGNITGDITIKRLSEDEVMKYINYIDKSKIIGAVHDLDTSKEFEKTFGINPRGKNIYNFPKGKSDEILLVLMYSIPHEYFLIYYP
jgi:hypothetical protein